MIASNKLWGRWQVFLGIVLLLNVVGFFYFIGFFFKNGYLPSPFLYDKSDTFMDLFNTLHWAYDAGRYTDWGSVYPPLNFFILRFFHFAFSSGGYAAPQVMRDTSPYIIVGFCFVYLLVPALLLKTRQWLTFPSNVKVIIYFIVVFSSPLLFALERGNMIVLALLLLPFILSQTGLARQTTIAILINLKPYFVLLTFYYVARRDWKGFAGCAALAGLIFLISGALLDANFLIFFLNLLSFSHGDAVFSLREVMSLPSSISAFSYVFRNPAGAMLAAGHLKAEMIPVVVYMIESAKWIVLIISFVGLVVKAQLLRDGEILALIVVAISNLGVWVGGYTIIFYVALIPVFVNLRWNWLYIGILALLAMPLDMVHLMTESIGMQYSYLSDSFLNIQWTLGLGSALRPVLNMVLLLALSYEFLVRKPRDTASSIVLG